METDVLDFTLRLSRVFGIAPFVNGTDYRVSRTIDICGKIIICIISLNYFLIGIVYLVSMTNIPVTLIYIQSASKLTTVIIGLIGTFTASERIKFIALREKDLNKMDLNISGLQKPSKKMYYTFLFYLLSVTILRILDFAKYCLEIGTILGISIHLCKILEYTIVMLLEMQLIVLSARVLLTLKMLNENLEQFYCNSISRNEQESDIAQNIPRAAWIETGGAKNNISISTTPNDIENYLHVETSNNNMSYRIRQLAKYYAKICDCVTQMTETDPYMMILILIYHMLHLKVNWHKIFLWVSTTKSTWYFLIDHLVRLIAHSIALILYVESFHQTHVQMERTFLTINLLKYRKSGDKEVCNELDLFFRLIMLNKTTYSPLGICTLARPLVVKIFGGLVTYVVFMMTYGTEKDLISIFLN